MSEHLEEKLAAAVDACRALGAQLEAVQAASDRWQAQLLCVQATIGEVISGEGFMPSSERLALMLHPHAAQWEKFLPKHPPTYP